METHLLSALTQGCHEIQQEEASEDDANEIDPITFIDIDRFAAKI